MSQQSPLATPTPWNAVAEGYTTEFLPVFSLYAQDALELAKLTPDAEVLDVAAGPGTLSLLAAKKARRVTALDFAESMTAVLSRRVTEAGVANIEVHVGDGQALPFADGCFDAGFSMFGLMFFPDRAKGFSELRRVLKPGGRAVVSSWTSIDRAPLLAAMFESLASLLQDQPFGSSKPPLADEQDFKAEMTAAGFRDVQIHTVEHRVEVESIESFWHRQSKASAPIVMLKQRIPEGEWQALSEQVVERMKARFGEAPLALSWPAHLGVGVK